MRDSLSGTKRIPTRSGKTQLSTRFARAARYVNRIHLSKGLEGAGFSWLGQNGRYRDKPGAVPGHGVRRAQPSVPSASAGGGPKPTSGGPRPTTGAAFPTVPGRAGQCVAPASGSRAWARRTSGGLGRRPRPRPALPAGSGLWAPSCPRQQAGPSPGAGPRQARSAWRAPASRWQVRLGRAGVTPARTGTQRLLPRDPGRRLQEATGWSLVRELSWSDLAAGRLKGVHSGESLRRRCHQAAVAAAASASAGCACACVPVSGRVGVCVQRLAFTIYTKGWEEAGKGRA